MARRALDFATAHPVADAGFAAVITRLQAEVAKADALGMLQGAGRDGEHAALSRRSAIRQSVESQQLRRLCRIADLAAVDHPGLAGRFVVPPAGAPNREFLLKARTLLADTTAEKELLSSLGLGDTFVEELTQAVADYETATASAHAARADHVGAGAELAAVAHRCTADVVVIDTYMRAKFATDPQILAAWRSARNIVGPNKAKAAEAAPPVPVTPPPAPVVSSAPAAAAPASGPNESAA